MPKSPSLTTCLQQEAAHPPSVSANTPRGFALGTMSASSVTTRCAPSRRCRHMRRSNGLESTSTHENERGLGLGDSSDNMSHQAPCAQADSDRVAPDFLFVPSKNHKIVKQCVHPSTAYAIPMKTLPMWRVLLGNSPMKKGQHGTLAVNRQCICIVVHRRQDMYRQPKQYRLPYR